MEPDDRIPGIEPMDQDPAPVSGSPPVRGIPRGVVVFPFVVATALTLVVLVGLGEPIRGRGVAMAFLVGGVAAASSMAWHTTHRLDATTAASARPPHAERESDLEQGMGSEQGPVLKSTDPGPESPPGADPQSRDDPLAHIHAVESQARRHQRPCPNCGTAVGVRREECPNCGHQLLVPCKGCRTRVRLEWPACPECGRSLP